MVLVSTEPRIDRVIGPPLEKRQLAHELARAKGRIMHPLAGHRIRDLDLTSLDQHEAILRSGRFKDDVTGTVAADRSDGADCRYLIVRERTRCHGVKIAADGVHGLHCERRSAWR